MKESFECEPDLRLCSLNEDGAIMIVGEACKCLSKYGIFLAKRNRGKIIS